MRLPLEHPGVPGSLGWGQQNEFLHILEVAFRKNGIGCPGGCLSPWGKV